METFLDKIYKFGTEGFFAMYLDKFQIIQGCDLEMYSRNQEIFGTKIPYNIYFILKRPKVTIDINSVKIENKKISLNALIQNKSKLTPISLDFDFTDAISDIYFKSDYPYNLFTIYDKKNHLMTARPGALLDELHTEKKLEIPLLDYEILYIGQAFGKDGKRTATDRLLSHSTLQKIYAESSSKNPDSDIFIMLTQFTQISLLASFGRLKSNPANEERDNDKAFQFFKEKEFSFSQKQRINFTEAALIKYFQPQYNLEFKDSFPSRTHKSYSECYDLDIRAMGIELDTSEMTRMIYTEKSGKKKRHFMSFSFDTNEDRFNLIDELE